MVTMHEVARAAGVSQTTVSHVINGTRFVSPERVERVQAAMRELDYTPAAAARALSTQRSHVIGVFLDTGEGHPDVQHPFFHDVLGGLKDAVGRADADTLALAALCAARRPLGVARRRLGARLRRRTLRAMAWSSVSQLAPSPPWPSASWRWVAPRPSDSPRPWGCSCSATG